VIGGEVFAVVNDRRRIIEALADLVTKPTIAVNAFCRTLYILQRPDIVPHELTLQDQVLWRIAVTASSGRA